MTITDKQARIILREWVKGNTTDYIYPTSKGEVAANLFRSREKKGKKIKDGKVQTEEVIDIEQAKEDFNELMEFWAKPIGKDTISDEEARKRLQELIDKARYYIYPEHRVYEDKIEEAKTAEAL